MPEKLLKPYSPKETEERIYKLWEDSGFFNPDVCVKKGITKADAPYFSIVLPPPNATGVLHLGHALEDSMQDTMIRYNRMQGKKTLWLPGTDHAAIATDSKITKMLEKEGLKKKDIGREKFLERVDAFVADSRKTIVKQLRKMGASLDWSREAFTFDEARNLAVRTAFKKMYDDGLIYRGHRIVNWDPKGQTVISDDEIVYEERKGKFYTFKYGPFEIGTARPETKFGDKYVVMHPDDKRYKKWKHGDKLTVEWINGPIEATVIKDKVIDMEFGTGVMTITPWHSHEDFLLAEKYKLEKEQIIDKFGKLLPVAQEFAGMKIADAREKIVEKLKNKGLLVSVDENYVNRVATAERTGGMIEPQIMLQWFIDVNKKIKDRGNKSLKELMLEPVREGKIKILPDHFEKVYFNWIENLRDWCISRQIWYGHRIPVWYCGGIEKTLREKISFADNIAPEVIKGKIRTYRLRDHNLKVGDKVIFENSGNKILFGNAIITNIIKTTVGEINLPDALHGNKYKTTPELIQAFKRLHPDNDVTEKTPAIIYDYQYYPFSKEDKETGCGQVITSVKAPAFCPACNGHKIFQDEDTLDTWFSSGLWTFSTLGWPDNNASDLKNFHPTSLMNPGYEILFFWVARMILMSQYLIGDIPFKIVYLHGILRDAKGQKFSKSLGNGVDPIEIIEQYGADALRMSMIVGIGPGADSKFDIQKVKAYGKFANKIWNIARYVLSVENTGKLKKELVNEFDSLLKEVTSDMENFRFYLAAEKLYSYIWHRFADKIIEESKGKKEYGATLYYILEKSLKILHPFMPFVTEEIWSMMPVKNKKLLMVEKWPFDSVQGKSND